jgi:hypothetical protein
MSPDHHGDIDETGVQHSRRTCGLGSSPDDVGRAHEMPATSRRRGRSSGSSGLAGRARADLRLPRRAPLGFGEVARLFAAASAWDLTGMGPPHRPASDVPSPPREAAIDRADAEAGAAILACLTAPGARAVRFSLAGLLVEPSLLDTVADAVREGAITAVALAPDPAAPVQALYSPGLEAFCLRDPLDMPPAKSAAVLRQAVLAGLHRVGVPPDAALPQAAGLVAEALCLLAALPGEGDGVTALATPVRRAALRLALRLRAMSGGTPAIEATDPDYAALCAAIAEAPDAATQPGAALGRLPIAGS